MRHHQPYPKNVEIANVITHGVGIIFALSAMPLLWSAAWQVPSITFWGIVIYGISFLAVFTTSTLYHSFTHVPTKFLWRKIDHIAIFYLIAGTYTPFLLIFKADAAGYTVLAIQWVLAIGGTFFKLYASIRYGYVSVIFYLLMGWLIVFLGKSLLEVIPASVLWLIAIGGILYTIGVLFYINKKYPVMHVVWHVFVLAAGIFHFAAVWKSVQLIA